MFAGQRGSDETAQPLTVATTPSHFPHSLQWFETQDWPFRYEIEPFRGNTFMRSYVSDGWTGKLFLEGVFALQQVSPSCCGRYGQMPAIILRKDRAAVREAE